MKEIDPKLLKILACPKCKTSITHDLGKIRCSNSNCGLVYPVRDGIPVMLVEEAELPVEEDHAE